MTPLERHDRLVRGLQRWLADQGDPPVVRETHISSLLLGREFVWKLKKPVDFGFLDFTDLQRRRYFCNEEIRINRRLAPALYLECRSVCGTLEQPRFGGDGEVLDYAVKMRRFADGALLSESPVSLDGEVVDRLCDRIIEFHQMADRTPPDAAFGRPERVFQPQADNFAALHRIAREMAPGHTMGEHLERLEGQVWRLHQQLTATLEQRREEGRIRECHGDLHLGNIALINGEPTPFDAIEFNPSLRWIDTFSDLAFLLMDLEEKDLGDLAARLLNRYLERSDDYGGLKVLRYYQIYRALVRAKVTGLALQQQAAAAERAHLQHELNAYLQRAERYATADTPLLVITCGPSGSGKSYTASRAATQRRMIHVRSDAVRKGLAGLAPEASSHHLPHSIYTSEFSAATYTRMLEITRTALEAGFSTIVDATFLKVVHRRPFQQLARQTGARYRILAFTLSREVMRERIRARNAKGGDASEADEEVLEGQLPQLEGLTAEEREYGIEVTPQQAESPPLP